MVETEIGIQDDYTTSTFSLLEKKEIIHHLLISASEIFFFRLNHDHIMWRNKGTIMMLAKYTDGLSLVVTRVYF